MDWYKKSSAEVCSELNVSFEKGLDGEEAKEKLKQYGLNILAREKKRTLLDLFVSQFRSPLIYILLGAAVLVFFIGDILDALVILAVIATNSIVGTIQEGRAADSLEKLRSLTHHKALVRRGGEEVLISAEEVVPGDILIIKEGDRISADGRIIKEESFKVDEAILTGEAYAVEKSAGVIGRDNLVVGDMKNVVFAGTSVVSGWCEAVVVATGLGSELGKISEEVKESAKVPLPLNAKITKLTHFIAIATFAIAGTVFLIGLLSGIAFGEIFGAAVGMVVSLVPEGLPVAVTIVLARGVWRMAKAKAIVRQMAAVEAMGNADTLLVDKTGTITTGKMVIREVLFGEEKFEVSGEGYEPKGEIKSKSKVGSQKSEVKVGSQSGEGKQSGGERLRNLLGLVYLAVRADAIKDENGGWKPSGDPTEVAIAVLARKAGLDREKLAKEYKTVFANPFDQEKRYIEGAFETCLPAGRGEKRKHHVFVGAPDFLSKKLKVDHGFSKQYHELAKEGMRVVGVAVFDESSRGPVSSFLPAPSLNSGQAVLSVYPERIRRAVGSPSTAATPSKSSDLVSWALLAIDEEVRPSVSESIKEAKVAGFGVVMLTGDYPETAREIAKKVGIFMLGDHVLTGVEVEKLTEVELSQKVDKVTVFARITPEHKLKIVQAFQRAGKICAMTGDGVNDAPALVAANLGIALGSGTQVAKDSSDIVLVNNNFETIVGAIAEGRGIYLTLKKVVLYLFSTSFGEVLVIGGSILIGLPLPLVAVQIIWLNFVTDGFFVVALASQAPKEGLILKNEVAGDSLVDRLMTVRIITMGGSMLVGLLVFWLFLQSYPIAYARTMALLVLSATQWFNALNVRSRYVSIFRKGMDNPYIIASFVIVFALQLLVIETVWGNRVMHTVNLTTGHWVLAIAVSTMVIWVEEGRKIIVRVMSQSGKYKMVIG